MGDYDFTDSDSLDDITAKLTAAEEALQLAKQEATRKKSTENLQELIEGKIEKLKERKEEIENK